MAVNQRWEYKILPVFNPVRSEGLLNCEADEGWRLVTALWPDDEHQYVPQDGHGRPCKGPWFILEREAPVAPDEEGGAHHGEQADHDAGRTQEEDQLDSGR
jgi:hypothetical protein